MTRSTRAEVRNPVLALPAFSGVQALPDDARQALRCLLLDLAADARERAEKCWRTHKGPMALYWKCVAVYAGHIARAIGKAKTEAQEREESEERIRAHGYKLGYPTTSDGRSWGR